MITDNTASIIDPIILASIRWRSVTTVVSVVERQRIDALFGCSNKRSGCWVSRSIPSFDEQCETADDESSSTGTSPTPLSNSTSFIAVTYTITSQNYNLEPRADKYNVAKAHRTPQWFLFYFACPTRTCTPTEKNHKACHFLCRCTISLSNIILAVWQMFHWTNILSYLSHSFQIRQCCNSLLLIFLHTN